MSRLCDTDKQDIISSNNNVTIVSCRLIVLVFSRTFKNYIHVIVTVYHLSPVLNMVLESDCNFLIYLLDQQIQRFP